MKDTTTSCLSLIKIERVYTHQCIVSIYNFVKRGGSISWTSDLSYDCGSLQHNTDEFHNCVL